MKVHLRMVGCRLNQAEIERMARQLTEQGHEVVDDPALAHHVVVNTCAVTQDAVRTSRRLVRQLHREQREASITVTGCYAQLEPTAAASLPGVARVVGNADKDRLVDLLAGGSEYAFDREPLARERPQIGRTRAFIKVQDGCDNACTFCITTVARGAGRSRLEAEIVAEVCALDALGYREIVLTGVHLGSYGHDRGEQDGLARLVARILAETDVPRVRLSSLEPWDLTPDFFQLWGDPRLCRHLHLPLQSGCDATLRRMARRTTQVQFAELVQAARSAVPDMSITTDVIVGFPGETTAEFETSCAFIEAQDFAGLHVFRYSRREGTAAARMRGQLHEEVKRERSARLIAYSERQEQRYAERFCGQTLPVLWEQVAGAREDGFVNVGYTDNYIRVSCVHARPLTNQLVSAHLDRFDAAQHHMVVQPCLD